MPFHREVFKGLKGIRRGIRRARQFAREDVADPLQELFEGEVLRRIGIGPIGTFAEHQRPAPSRVPSPPRISVGTARRKVRERKRLERQGFQTPQLVKVAATGAQAQQRQAREKMRRLGRRLRGRVDF
jgi:hypothetical protein